MSPMTVVVTLLVLGLVLHRTVQTARSLPLRIGAVSAVLVGVAPALWVMLARGVSPKLVLGYGAAFFIASVLLKWVLFRGVMTTRVHPRLGHVAGGVAQGGLSAACELGVAALALGLVFPDLPFWDVFGFGSAAAYTEALIVGLVGRDLHTGAPSEAHVGRELAALERAPSWLAAGVPFVERTIATTDHIACRGLVAAGLASGQTWPLALAFATFAITDGLAQYWMTRERSFADPSGALRLYTPMALTAVAAVAGWMLAR